MQEQINQLQAQVLELANTVNAMRNASSIPFDIDAAFRERLGGGLKVFNLNGGTILKSVNESGSATYDVAKAMDGSLSTTFNGVAIKLPFYLG